MKTSTGRIYEKRVKVLIIAEGVKDEHMHDLPGTTTYWLHTSGMTKWYAMPELEIVNVPALWIDAAGAFLNGWAKYMIRKRKAIAAGETLLGSDAVVPVVLRAVPSPDPFWIGREPCLRLVPERVAHFCHACGTGD